MLFSLEGLQELGWSVNDLAENLGFPREWIDVAPDWPDREQEILRLLRREGPDEEFEAYISKYDIDIKPPRNL